MSVYVSFLCSMYYCLFKFNLGNVSNCIEMYLGIVNETEIENCGLSPCLFPEVLPIDPSHIIPQTLHMAAVCSCANSQILFGKVSS